MKWANGERGEQKIKGEMVIHWGCVQNVEELHTKCMVRFIDNPKLAKMVKTYDLYLIIMQLNLRIFGS